MLRKFALLIGIISALPFRLILLILSPIVLIRFAFVDAPRMGSLILDAELYLIENKDYAKTKEWLRFFKFVVHNIESKEKYIYYYFVSTLKELYRSL